MSKTKNNFNKNQCIPIWRMLCAANKQFYTITHNKESNIQYKLSKNKPQLNKKWPSDSERLSSFETTLFSQQNATQTMHANPPQFGSWTHPYDQISRPLTC